MRGVIREVSPAALAHNWRRVRRVAAARRMLAVVKADGYGHGLLTVAEALRELADGFAVVDLRDALALRAHGVAAPIVLLQGIFAAEEVEAVAEARLSPVVHSAWQIRALGGAAARARLTVFVKINSGMNRLGFDVSEAAAAVAALRRTAAVAEVVLMSHFADADAPGGMARQLAALAPLRALRLPWSLGNSAAALWGGDIGDDAARVGIALYGVSPAPARAGAAALGLAPAMRCWARLIAVREVAAGARVGYGGAFVAAAAMRVGIAGAGYGDGYPRRRGLWAEVGGGRAPVLGRVSMEMTALDLGGGAAARVGDEVTLWGDAPAPAVDEVAAAAGVIGYELLVGVRGRRVCAGGGG